MKVVLFSTNKHGFFVLSGIIVIRRVNGSFYILVLFLFGCVAGSGAASVGNLLVELNKSPNDSIKVQILDKIIVEYLPGDPNEALKYIRQQEELAKELNYTFGKYMVLYNYTELYYWLWQYDKMLDVLRNNDKVIREKRMEKAKGKQLLFYGRYYDKTNQKDKAIAYYLQEVDFFNRKKDEGTRVTFFINYQV